MAAMLTTDEPVVIAKVLMADKTTMAASVTANKTTMAAIMTADKTTNTSQVIPSVTP